MATRILHDVFIYIARSTLGSRFRSIKILRLHPSKDYPENRAFLALITIMFSSTQDCSLRYQPFICAHGKDHCPRTSLRRKQLKEWLFSAAYAGCRPCVQHCIEVLRVDAHVQSDNMHYTVMDWAQWAVGKKVDGAQEVINYLISSCGYALPIAEPSASSPIDDLQQRLHSASPGDFIKLDNDPLTDGLPFCMNCGCFEPFQDWTEECCWNERGVKCVFANNPQSG